MDLHTTEPVPNPGRQASSLAYDGTPEIHQKYDTNLESLHAMEIGPPIPQGHDEALDDRADLEPSTPVALMEIEQKEHPKANLEDSPSTDEDDEEYCQVPISTFSVGMTTFSYQQALRNRIKDSKIARHGEYDTRKYTPTFIHDCLMLPGSLANVLGKGSAAEVVHRMTPALLPAFHAHVHADTYQPCLLQSDNLDDYVQGMVIFGQGKSARQRIHEHYRPNARRVKLEIEIDVQVSSSSEEHDGCPRWYLQRRRIWAHAWLWSNAGSGDSPFLAEAGGWTLEDYLAGDIGPKPDLRIEPTGMLDDEGRLNRRDGVNDHREREAVYGGSGHLDYERVEDGWSGW